MAYRNLENTLNFLSKEHSKKKSPVQAKITPIDYNVKPPEPPGTIAEGLSMLAKGYVADLTWGASEFTGEEGIGTGSFADMNLYERIGYGVGSGLALMTPYVGPFHILGKATRGVVSATTKMGTKNIIK